MAGENRSKRTEPVSDLLGRVVSIRSAHTTEQHGRATHDYPADVQGELEGNEKPSREMAGRLGAPDGHNRVQVSRADACTYPCEDHPHCALCRGLYGVASVASLREFRAKMDGRGPNSSPAAARRQRSIDSRPRSSSCGRGRLRSSHRVGSRSEFRGLWKREVVSLWVGSTCKGFVCVQYAETIPP